MYRIPTKCFKVLTHTFDSSIIHRHIRYTKLNNKQQSSDRLVSKLLCEPYHVGKKRVSWNYKTIIRYNIEMSFHKKYYEYDFKFEYNL